MGSRQDMKSIGDLLKQRRKEMNLSLKEVENTTSIRMSYLQAIEEGEIGKLISPIYAQGFFKQYAAFLGLDGESIIREHPEIFTRLNAPEFTYGIGTMEARGNPGGGIKWFPNAIWIGVFFLILLTAWFVAKNLEVI